MPQKKLNMPSFRFTVYLLILLYAMMAMTGMELDVIVAVLLVMTVDYFIPIDQHRKRWLATLISIALSMLISQVLTFIYDTASVRRELDITKAELALCRRRWFC